MDQHERISGYRKFTDDEIKIINEIKSISSNCGILVDRLRKQVYSTQSAPAEGGVLVYDTEADQRWVSIAATHLQEGFMALTRSVAKPTTF